MDIKKFKLVAENINVELEDVRVAKNNNVFLEGVKVITDNGLCPTIYEDTIKELDEIEAVKLLTKLKKEGGRTINIIDKLSNKDFVYSRVRYGVRNKELNKDDDKVWTIPCEKPFDNLEKYIYISLNEDECAECGMVNNSGKARIKINESIIKNAGLSKESLMMKAYQNTEKEIKIESMESVLSNMMGLPFMDDSESRLFENIGLYVATTNDGLFGASAILYKSKLNEFALSKGMKFYAVLPSSIHEVLIFKLTSIDQKELLDDMVNEVNRTEVKPEEVLGTEAYILSTEC